jgi:hypothetical protein
MNSANDAQTHQGVPQEGKIKGAFTQCLSLAADTGIKQWGTIFMELDSANDISL